MTLLSCYIISRAEKLNNCSAGTTEDILVEINYRALGGCQAQAGDKQDCLMEETN